MSFDAAIATQPQWVQIWVNLLGFGAFIAPLILLIWRDTRKTGLIVFILSALSAASIVWLYNMQGLTRITGAPHIIFWLPALYVLWGNIQRGAPRIPLILMWFTLAVICVSLAFDGVDVLRYALGERGSMVPS